MSVAATAVSGVYVCQVTIDFEDGSPVGKHTFTYHPDNHFGLSDEVGAAISEWISSGSPVTPYSPPGVTTDQVDAERDRRINAGTTLPVPGIDGGIPMTGRLQDQTALTALLIKAQALSSQGVTAPIMPLRDADNNNWTLTPGQMTSLVMAGLQWIEKTMEVSWAMKDHDPPFQSGIPSDYATNERYWPKGDPSQ